MEKGKEEDISLFSALLLGIGIVLLLVYLQNREFVENNFSAFESYLILTKWYFSVFAVCIFTNVIIIALFLRRVLGLSKQGAKLRSIKSSNENSKKSFREILILSVISMGAGMLSAYFLQPKEILTMDSIYLFHTGVFILNISFLSWFLSSRANDIYQNAFRDQRNFEIEEAPVKANSINLGTTINPDDCNKVERFVNIDENALYGSILITGSKGSGKTSGALLPYLDQIIRNFPKVSMLILDPKRTFIQNAKKIVKKHKPNAVVRILSTGDSDNFSVKDSEKINPVYLEKPLKQSRFVNIAEMVRSCSVNFSKGGSDSPFWEINSFTLLKNIIVYNAAKLGYFTITDIYEAIICAANSNHGEELSSILNIDKCGFDEEERFNIERAIKYFSFEYRNLDDKVKSGIMATATLFLNQFQEYRANKVFCPKKDERTILSIDSIIDNGEILMMDISSPALARAMGTMIKLLFEQSNLDRLANPNRKLVIPSVLIGDEIQDTATVGDGMALGDESFLAKGREAKTIVIGATQSLVSLENKIGSKKATEEYIQNYRTRIAFHSGDIQTVKNFQELVGKKDIERESRSISEISNRTERNFILGGFDSSNANISESMSVSKQKDYELTGREFTELKTFEAWGLVYDGISTKVQKLLMKPLFLEKPETLHSEVLEKLGGKPKEKTKVGLKRLIGGLAATFSISSAAAFPNICSVIKQPSFNSCMKYKAVPFLCSVYPVKWCAYFSYYIPQSFIETTTSKGLSHFSSLPGAALQLSTVGMKGNYGAVNDDDTQSFQGRTLAIPLSGTLLGELPCGGERDEKLCFDGMSEHFDPHWNTGSGDLLQPKFLAWKASPKACLIKGALTSGGSKTSSSDSSTCSYPRGFQKLFTPSSMPVCTTWGVMYPRSGTQVGGSEIAGSLTIASRIKSLSVEVLQSMPSSKSEKWSMLSPNATKCFKEFDNLAKLETVNMVNNRNRAAGKDLTGNLFTTWKKVSCVRDIEEMFTTPAYLAILQATCAVSP